MLGIAGPSPEARPGRGCSPRPRPSSRLGEAGVGESHAVPREAVARGHTIDLECTGRGGILPSARDRQSSLAEAVRSVAIGGRRTQEGVCAVGRDQGDRGAGDRLPLHVGGPTDDRDRGRRLGRPREPQPRPQAWSPGPPWPSGAVRHVRRSGQRRLPMPVRPRPRSAAVASLSFGSNMILSTFRFAAGPRPEWKVPTMDHD